jgi:hypothetical protein
MDGIDALLIAGMKHLLVLRPASNLRNTDRFNQSSFSTKQVSGVGCQ